MLLGMAGCASSQAAGGDDRTIKIAVMDSSLVYSSDDSYENGIAMAIEDLNTLYGEQGYEISYEFYDDGAFYQQGLGVINEILADPEITAVVGTSSLNLLDVTADVLNSAGKLCYINERKTGNGSRPIPVFPTKKRVWKLFSYFWGLP